MPRPLEGLTLYLLLSVALVDSLIALVVVYEIFVNTGDSWERTIVNIAYGISASLAVTIVVFANVEVVRLLAKMYDRKRYNQVMAEGLEKGRAEGRVEGRAEGREEGLERGRAEGREQGVEEGRAEAKRQQRDRLQEAYDRFGVDMDGVRVLPRTPEVEAFLRGNDDQASE